MESKANSSLLSIGWMARQGSCSRSYLDSTLRQNNAVINVGEGAVAKNTIA